METWQAILAATATVAAGVWGAVRWYLQFQEKSLEKQRAHELLLEDRKEAHDLEMSERFEKMESAFLTTLGTLQRECMERDAHQRDLRLADQERHITMLHEVAMKLKSTPPPGTKPSSP